MQTRRRFLRNTALLGAGLGLGWCGNAPAEQELPGRAAPNIVLIMLDTVRADKLGCYGGRKDVSPALDRIAEKGAVLERVIAQCSWTRPSIASFLTSRYPRSLGLYLEKDEILNAHFDTLPRALQRHGYRTFGATANPNLNQIYNFHLGFDEYMESDVVFSWMSGARPENLRGKVPLPSAPSLFDRALDFARRHPQGPCYIQLNLMEVHEWYVRKEYTLTRPEYRTMFLRFGERYPQYLQAVRQLTDDTANFVARLAAEPGWDNTLFAIVSDHGEGLDDHPGIAKSLYHGWLLYESQVVVPWILYGPRWNPAQPRIRQPVRLLELAPTLLDLAGAPPLQGAEGISLRPLLEGKVDKVALPEYFITETDFRGASKVGAYAAEWKYFENLAAHAGLSPRELQKKGGREQGLRTDQASVHPEVAASMRAFMESWINTMAKSPPTRPQETLGEEEKQQLQAIGYLDDEPVSGDK